MAGSWREYPLLIPEVKCKEVGSWSKDNPVCENLDSVLVINKNDLFFLVCFTYKISHAEMVLSQRPVGKHKLQIKASSWKWRETF